MAVSPTAAAAPTRSASPAAGFSSAARHSVSRPASAAAASGQPFSLAVDQGCHCADALSPSIFQMHPPKGQQDDRSLVNG